MAEGVLLLDDDEDLLNSLGDVIAVISTRSCLKLRSLSELISRREQALRCSLAILDVHLGVDQPSGLDAYAFLRTEYFAGRIVFLTGHASDHPLVERASRLGIVQVLRKPIEVSALQQLIDHAQPHGSRI